MRREEAEAQRFLLYQEQCNDLRAQLHAATAWLAERTGLSNRDLNEQLAARVAANRKAESCPTDSRS